MFVVYGSKDLCVCFCYVHENGHETTIFNTHFQRSIFLLLMFVVPVLIPVIPHY
ncbi:unnamed protein product, partial [Brassica oleracea]